jgi:ML domain
MFIVFLFLVLCQLIYGHDFTTCLQNAPLQIDSINLQPDPPMINQILTIDIMGVTNVDIKNGTELIVSISSFGIKIFTTSLDLCSMVNDCPITKQFDMKVTEEIPAFIQRDIKLDLHIVVKQQEQELACIETSFKIMK